MPSPWIASGASIGARAAVVFAVAGLGCGRSELDQAYPVSADVSRDGGGGNTRDVGHPTPPSDAAPPLPDAATPVPDATQPIPDAAQPALVGCAGAVRCRNGVAESCAGEATWTPGVPYTVCDRPTSCQMPGEGFSDCGPEHEDCCTTIQVPGGDYVRSYDGVSCPGGPSPPPPPAFGCYTSPDHPATVSTFRLDKYLVTVARFRRFLDAIRTSGWRPPAASGRHGHLNSGRGLADVGGAGAFESGWDAAWSDEDLLREPGDNDNTVPKMPINGVTWAQAYAFCIWDGGFLPSEAEWNYAAAGGSEQRVYPWSRPPRDTTVSCTQAAYTERVDPNACFQSGAYSVGEKSPAGDGRWGHADLAGLRGEWTLDWLREYVDPCVDCANLKAPDSSERVTTDPSRVVRGYLRSVPTAPPGLLTSLRGDDSYQWIGFRCAREPLTMLGF